jgi:hypothetical protein
MPAAFTLAGLMAVGTGLLFQAARVAGANPPVRMTKQEDHQRTMDLLHTSLSCAAAKPEEKRAIPTSPIAIWPLITGVPAFLVALVLTALLARLSLCRAGHAGR